MTKRDTDRVMRKFANSGIDLQDEYATRWLASHLSKIRTTMRQETFIDSSETTRLKGIYPGRMYFFGYSPKTKDELHFWDEFPIVIALHRKRGGFLGLNLHYLSPNLRVQFLNRLLAFADDPNYAKNNNKATRMRVTYGLLKHSASLRLFKHCIKRYHYSHIRTKMAFIPPNEWKAVPFFPLDRFRGITRDMVWRLSR